MSVTLPASASASVRDVLVAPPRPAEVLGVFPRGAYLRVDATLVALVTADAPRLPCSVVLGEKLDLTATVRGHDDDVAAVVGGGRVRLGAVTATIGRWWAPRRPRRLAMACLRRCDLGAAAALVPSLPDDVAHPARALGDVLRVGEPPRDVRLPARALLGLGPGLTPAGDDVLTGLLLTLAAGPVWGQRLAAELVAAVVPDAAHQTTAVSAALLRHAAQGEGLPQVVNALDGLGAGDGARVTSAVAELLEVGSSSGGALAHGVLMGARTLASATGASSTGLEVA